MGQILWYNSSHAYIRGPNGEAVKNPLVCKGPETENTTIRKNVCSKHPECKGGPHRDAGWGFPTSPCVIPREPPLPMNQKYRSEVVEDDK